MCVAPNDLANPRLCARRSMATIIPGIAPAVCSINQRPHRPAAQDYDYVPGLNVRRPGNLLHTEDRLSQRQLGLSSVFERDGVGLRLEIVVTRPASRVYACDEVSNLEPRDILSNFYDGSASFVPWQK